MGFFFLPSLFLHVFWEPISQKKVLIQPTIVIEVSGFALKPNWLYWRTVLAPLVPLVRLAENFTASLKRQKYAVETWLPQKKHFAALPFLCISLQSAEFQHMLGSTCGRKRTTLQRAALSAAESCSSAAALIWKQLWGKRRRQTSNKQARRWCSSFYEIITAVRHQTSCQTASLMRRSTCWAGWNPDGCAIAGFHCERLSSANSLDTAVPAEGHAGRRSTRQQEIHERKSFGSHYIKVYLFFCSWFPHAPRTLS